MLRPCLNLALTIPIKKMKTHFFLSHRRRTAVRTKSTWKLLTAMWYRITSCLRNPPRRASSTRLLLTPICWKSQFRSARKATAQMQNVSQEVKPRARLQRDRSRSGALSPFHHSRKILLISQFFHFSFVSVYVQSNTLVGDQIHPVGRVLAEIVKANIPVKNGVVHLISSPLMIVDNTVSQFLEVGLFYFCY